MKKFSLGAFVALAIAAISILSGSPVRSAEKKAGFSNGSLTGAFVFRTSGHSLFTSPEDATSVPVYLASSGLVTFDGRGSLSGTVATSATRTDVIGKAAGPYSSQVLCKLKMTGSYVVEADGTGSMTINFSPSKKTVACGASTGEFDIVLVSANMAELVSSGQLMADPSKGSFNAYVVQGELMRQSGERAGAKP